MALKNIISIINDMFECSDFINKDQNLILNKKLYIDEFVFDFLSKPKE
jgi:hypothetical protein